MSGSHIASLLPRIPSKEGAHYDWTRWAIVAFFVSLVFIPYLFAPSLAHVDRSMIRAGIMLAEVGVVLVWSLTRKAVTWSGPINRGVWIVGGVWVAGVLVATCVAVHVAPAVLRSAELLSHCLFAAVLWVELQRDQKTLAAAARAIPIGFIGLVIVIVLSAARHSDPFHYDWLHNVPYLGHVRRLGMYALAGVAFSARSFVLSSSSQRFRAWGWMSLTISWAVLFWSGGRGSIVAGLLIGGCLCGLVKGRRAHVAKAFVSAVGVGMVVSLMFPVANTELGIGRFLLRVGEAGEAGQFTSGRSALWKTALAEWGQRPWFGLGPDATAFILAPFGHIQPHNFVVQALVEWGLVGTAAFIVLLGGGLITAGRRTIRERDTALRASRAVATSYLVGMAALGLLDGVFYHARPLALVAAAAAMALLPAEDGLSRRYALSREVRLGVRVSSLGVLLLVFVHALSVKAVWSPGVPAPNSVRTTFIQAFPTTASLRETAAWAQAWAVDDPEAARAWARWGSQHAVLPWFYLQLEADLLLQRGKVEEAEALFSEASRLEAAASRFQ